MIKLLSIALALLLLAVPAAASEPATDTQRETPEITFLQEAAIATESSCLQINGEIPQELSIAQGGCCKVCRKGKACGNSCINRSYNCTRPRGCACDG